MLMLVKVEKLVIAAIPDLVSTWTEGFGFVPVEDSEKRSLNKINLMVFPGTVLLKKPLYDNKKTHDQSGGCSLFISTAQSCLFWKILFSLWMTNGQVMHQPLQINQQM